MRILLLLLSTFMLSPIWAKEKCEKGKFQEIKQEELGKILDSLLLNGSILVFDPQENIYYSNDFQWSKTPRLPASTFKIPNSLIGLETGVVKDENYLFKWNGEKRRFEFWEKDLTLKEAFQYSCLPCYQEIARNVGIKNMKKYLKVLGYKNMDVSPETLDNFWLQGKSAISQWEQIDFLKRIYNREMKISSRTYDIMQKVFVNEQTETYILSGKTGWSTQDNVDNGWFVGYLETQNKVYYFAVNVEPKPEMDIDDFLSARKIAAKQALSVLGMLR